MVRARTHDGRGRPPYSHTRTLTLPYTHSAARAVWCVVRLDPAGKHPGRLGRGCGPAGASGHRRRGARRPPRQPRMTCTNAIVCSIYMWSPTLPSPRRLRRRPRGRPWRKHLPTHARVSVVPSYGYACAERNPYLSDGLFEDLKVVVEQARLVIALLRHRTHQRQEPREDDPPSSHQPPPSAGHGTA
jgi:hypothetical protein